MRRRFGDRRSAIGDLKPSGDVLKRENRCVSSTGSRQSENAAWTFERQSLRFYGRAEDPRNAQRWIALDRIDRSIMRIAMRSRDMSG